MALNSGTAPTINGLIKRFVTDGMQKHMLCQTEVGGLTNLILQVQPSHCAESLQEHTRPCQPRRQCAAVAPTDQKGTCGVVSHLNVCKAVGPPAHWVCAAAHGNRYGACGAANTNLLAAVHLCDSLDAPLAVEYTTTRCLGGGAGVYRRELSSRA